jgi:hypothetical protein
VWRKDLPDRVAGGDVSRERESSAGAIELAGQAGNGVVVKGADAGGFYWDDLVG